MKIGILEIPYYSRSIQGIIWDYKSYCDKHGVKYRVKIYREFEEQIFGKGSFARIQIDDLAILFDLQDNPCNYDFYKNYDFVFKRSYLNQPNIYSDNVLPLGMRFDVFDGFWHVFKTNLLKIFIDKRNRKEFIRTVLNIIGFDYLGYNNLRRTWNKLLNEPQTNTGSENNILFISRLYTNNNAGIKISKERQEINNQLKNREDVLFNSLNHIQQSDYIEKLKDSGIVVINNGLHDVPGARLPELLLLGKTVLSTKLNVIVPGLTSEHFFEFESDKLNIELEKVIRNPINVYNKRARNFMLENYGPARRFENILKEIRFHRK